MNILGKNEIKPLILQRIQCLRDIIDAVRARIELLDDSRDLCCGEGNFFFLDEDNNFEEDENGDMPILENAP